MAKPKLESKQLDLIDEGTRYSIANALRAAATRWNEVAVEFATVSIGETFKQQAAEALEWAETFEDC